MSSLITHLYSRIGSPATLGVLAELVDELIATFTSSDTDVKLNALGAATFAGAAGAAALAALGAMASIELIMPPTARAAKPLTLALELPPADVARRAANWIPICIPSSRYVSSEGSPLRTTWIVTHSNERVHLRER